MTAHLPEPSRGFALVSVAILLGITLTFTLILADSILSGRQAGKSLEQSFEATGIASAGIDKAIYCLNAAVGTNCGGSYGSSYAGETDVPTGDGTFTTMVIGTGNTRTITSVGTLQGATTTIVTDVTTVPADDAMAFSYALQAGAGGARLENNAEITGTIYADGDIECQSTNSRVTGDAYVTKTNGFIDSCRIFYHAHADSVLNSQIDGDAYYAIDPSGVSGTTVAGTKYSGSTRPVPIPLPEVDLDFWRDAAESGGLIVGNHAPADNSTLGPVKIIGDLTLGNNVDVTLMGPVWVVGNITMSNNSTFTVHPSFGANGTALLADDQANLATKGKFSAVPNTGLFGSGNSKSHIVVIATNSSVNDADPAISVSNNASGAVFYALNGTLRLQNNAGAKSLAAYRLFIDQNAIVSYVESELSDMSFSNSPGGIWAVSPGTWRIVR